MEEKIIKADKKARIINLVIILILIIAAYFIYSYMQDYYKELNKLVDNHPDQALTKAMNLIRLFIVINPIITFGFMLYFIVIGAKTYKSGQFPPPGVKVIRNTKLITGSKAKKYAAGLWIFAAVLLAFAIAATVLLNNLLRTII